MNVEVTQRNIAHAALAACRATPQSPASKPANPMAGCATPAGIAAAAAAAHGSMPDTTLLLEAFRRLAAVRGDTELQVLCLNLETVLEEKRVV